MGHFHLTLNIQPYSIFLFLEHFVPSQTILLQPECLLLPSPAWLHSAHSLLSVLRQQSHRALGGKNIFNLIKDIYKNPVANIILSGESACLLPELQRKTAHLHHSPGGSGCCHKAGKDKKHKVQEALYPFTADTVKIPELTPEFIVIQKTQNRQNNTEKNAGYLKRFQTSHPIRSGPERCSTMTPQPCLPETILSSWWSTPQ